MVVFLPAPGSTLEAFTRGLSAAEWQRRLRLLGHRPGRVELPRLKSESRHALGGPLQDLGMRRAFSSEQADFSGLLAPGSGRRPHISAVSQSVFMEVDEKGTEAAAATVVTMAAPTSAAPRERPTPFTMIVDRPYFLAIEDTATGAVLFLGGIRDPG